MESCIFEGRVRHTRRHPVAHRFTYRIFLMYLDLAELPDVFERHWLWSAEHPTPARFRREDHLGPASLPLDEAVRRLVAERCGRPPEGPIRLLTHLSYFGYCFNPVSFYYCFDRSGTAIEAIVAEVHNTPWGERHCYVLPSSEVAGSGRTMRFEAPKVMHVSPFMESDLRYEWSMTNPGKRLDVFIASSRGTRRFFDVSMVLKRREIGSVALARTLVAYPLMTMRVMLAIHWQALRLWLKRCPVYPHPRKQSTHVDSR